MANSDVMVFPESNSRNSVDPALLLALNNNGGMNNPFWMMFMWPLMYPFMNMFGGGFWGNNWNNGGNSFVANQLNNDAGRQLIVEAINGRADALSQLAGITQSSVENVRDAIGILNSKLTEVGGQVGMSGLQVINAIQGGNATLANQLCQCCCENRLAIVNQTNQLQAQAAANYASTQLQLAQNEAADQLSVCQQTNQLGSQADRNTNTLLKAIADQNTLITKEFCDLKERELQDKINTQGDIITQLRGQISNDKQTEAFNAAINTLNEKINQIAAKQPNTVPVTYPNLTAVNNTPYNYGNMYAGSFWG